MFVISPIRYRWLNGVFRDMFANCKHIAIKGNAMPLSKPSNWLVRVNMSRPANGHCSQMKSLWML